MFGRICVCFFCFFVDGVSHGHGVEGLYCESWSLLFKKKKKFWSSYKDAIKPYLSASIWRPFNKKKSQTQKISCSSIANICLDFWGQDRKKLNCFHGMCVLWFTSTPTPLSGLVWWFLLSLFLPALTVLRAPHLVPVQPFWQLCLRHLHVPSAGSDSRTLTETLTAALWPLTTKDVTWFHCQLRWVPDFTALMRQFSRDPLRHLFSSLLFLAHLGWQAAARWKESRSRCTVTTDEPLSPDGHVGRH